MSKFFYKRKLDEIEEKARPVHINSYKQLACGRNSKEPQTLPFGAVVLIGVAFFTLFGPLR